MKFPINTLHSFHRKTPFGALLLVVLLATSSSPAAPVTFWFSGVIDFINAPGGTPPPGVTVGIPFTGRVAYDADYLASTSSLSFPPGEVSNYYFTNTAGYLFMVQMGGHTFANTNPPSGAICGNIGIKNDLNEEDGFTTDTASAPILMDDGLFLNGSAAATMYLVLRDPAQTAYSSTLLPTTSPSLGQFPGPNRFELAVLTPDQSAYLYGISGVITNLTTTEQIQLHLRRLTPTTLQLAWPLAATGFTLQSRTNLAAGSWQNVVAPVTDTATEHTVTVSTTDGQQFFRLKK